VDNYVAPFTSHGKLHAFGAEYQFPELKRHILTFPQIMLHAAHFDVFALNVTGGTI
jgi:hypothetical protein